LLQDSSISGGNPSTFISRSEIYIRGNAGSCNTLPGTYYQGTNVTVSRTELGLAIANVPATISDCQPLSIDINVSFKTHWDTADNESVIVKFPQDNYKYKSFSVTGFGGQSPTVGDEGTKKTFTFSKIAVPGTLTLNLVRRCAPTGNDFQAELYYKDGLSISRSTTATQGVILVTKGLLELLVSPEEIPLLKSQISWKMIVTDRGAGKAYDTRVVNRISQLFVFDSSTINGVPATPTITSSGGYTFLEWSLGDLTPNQSSIIILNVKLSGITCNLSNASQIEAYFGCEGTKCDSVIVDKPIFSLPNTKLETKNLTPSPILLCDTGYIHVGVKNIGSTAGYDVEVYVDLLSTNFQYVPGTSSIQLDSGGLQALADPTITGTLLSWKPSASPGGPVLQELPVNSFYTIKFQVQTDCSFATNTDISIYAKFNRPCQIGQTPVNTTPVLTSATPRGIPVLGVVKQVRQDTSPFADSWFVDATKDVEFQIAISNTGQATMQNILLKETIPNWLAYKPGSFVPVSPTPAPISITPSGNTIDVRVPNLPINTTYTYRYFTTVSSCGGPNDSQSVVSFGCDATSCFLPPAQSVTDVASIDARPNVTQSYTAANFNTCTGRFTITVSNTRAKAKDLVLVSALPTGFVYDNSSNGTEITSNVAHTFNETEEEPQISPDQKQLTWGLNADNSNNTNFYILPNETITIVFYVKTDGTYCDTNPDADPAQVPTTNSTLTLNYKNTCSVVMTPLSTVRSVNPTSPDLDIAVTPEAQIITLTSPTNQATWTITTTNNGDGGASNYTIIATVGAGLQINSAGNGTISGQTITWTSGVGGVPSTINPGVANAYAQVVKATIKTGGTDLSFHIQVKGQCRNRAGVYTCDYSYDQARAYTAGIDFQKQIIDPNTQNPIADPKATMGEIVTYRITTKFFGNGNYSNAVIKDTLPTELEYSEPAIKGPEHDISPTLPTPGVVVGGQTGQWDVGVFAISGTMKTFQAILKVRVKNIGVDGNTRTNTATTDFKLNFGTKEIEFKNTDYPTLLQKTATLRLIEPNLLIQKTNNDADGIAIAGDSIVYTVKVTNLGNSSGYDIIVEDIVPPGMRVADPTGTVVVEFDGSPVPAAQYTISYNAGTGQLLIDFKTTVVIPNDPARPLTIRYTTKVDATVGPGLEMTNEASIVEYFSQPNNPAQTRKYGPIGPDTNTIVTPSLPVSTKTVQVEYTEPGGYAEVRQATIGEKCSYKIEVTIPTGTTAYNFEFYDLFPDGLQVVSTNITTPGGSGALEVNYNPGNGTTEVKSVLGSIGKLNSGETLIVLVETRLKPGYISTAPIKAGDTISNQASYTYYRLPATPGSSITLSSNVSSLDVREPKLTIAHVKTTPGTEVIANELITLRIDLIQNGTLLSKAYETKVTAKLATGLRTNGVISSTAAVDSYDPATGLITWKVMTVPTTGSSITYQVRVDADVGAGRFKQTNLVTPATIVEYFSLPDVGNNPLRRQYDPSSASVALTTPVPEIQKSQTVNGSGTAIVVKPGDTVIYTLTIPKTPIGATLFNPLVQDTVPDGFVITNVVNGTYSGRLVTATPPQLPNILPNEQKTVVITMTAQPAFESGQKIPAGHTFQNSFTLRWDNHKTTVPEEKLPARYTIASNVVSLLNPGITFQQDQSTTSIPGGTFFYRHVLKNLSPLPDIIQFNAIPPTSIQNWSYQIFKGNGNGNIVGSPITSLSLNPNEAVEIIVKGFVPEGTATGTRDLYNITAVPNLNPSQAITLSDIVVVQGLDAGGKLQLFKSVDKPQAFPGDTLTYTITYLNNGVGEVGNVEIRDPVSTHVQFLLGTYPGGKDILWQKPNGDIVYLTAAPSDDEATLENGIVYLRMGTLKIKPGLSGMVQYQVKIK